MAYDRSNSNFFNASGKVVSRGRYIIGKAIVHWHRRHGCTVKNSKLGTLT